MTATLAHYFDEFVNTTQEPQQLPVKPLVQRQFQPDTDIKRWLTSNAPRNRQELMDLRYCLYHRGSRAGFKVKKSSRDYFTLTGRTSSLLIVSNKARRFLLWQLRILARKRGWVAAIIFRTKPLVASYT
jgi:hypothetical protein